MSLALTTFRAFLFLSSFSGAEKQLVRLVKGVLDWWAGKKIAVIGPTASGKDSFLGEKVSSFSVKLALSHHQVIEITCKGVINIGGETDYRDAPSGWLAVCKDADVIFYMMTIKDLSGSRFLNGRRIRQDLDWLLTALPHLKEGVLIHILINKIDEEIESHTDYRALAEELSKKLESLDQTVKKVLHPYEAGYTGATLISMKNKQIYTRAINNVLRSVYSAFHGAAKRKKAR